MNDVIKIVKSLKISGLVLKGVAKTNENKTREQRTGILIMLLGNLGASLLQNFLSGTGVIWARDGVIKLAMEWKKRVSLKPFHTLSNLDIQRYF